MRKAGIQFVLCSLKPTVAELLDLTRLNKLFSIYEEEADAVAEM